MDLPFLHDKCDKYGVENSVSILVLMDLPFLQLDSSLLCLMSMESFNPCSYGSSVLTLKKDIQCLKRQLRFNPCSYGSSVLTHRMDESTALPGTGFNPCSYGSSVLTSQKGSQNVYANEVSILVLMDLPFLHSAGRNYRRSHRGRFNPCSYGSSVLTLGDIITIYNDSMFQSLFLWIFRSYMINATNTQLKTVSFNPCSYGSSVLTQEMTTHQLTKLEVSILVLMDLPFLQII